ncbi:TetR/AcrR family transcriptional regulator [Bacillus sp. FJAT-49732]|uniref:TetR/AcrR family transcriptional regulator n=1 Tax=Lederbergia citrisecunda TaxID=2833583 RepID=A0A942TML1_9BACI|nr:TetR/AcrR family transcriptional regulator [Lederbergia citrisecunda]MBS4201056.1 TetR/AcrR family transcriptional regulator [Lederbergia citrisecunda]
MAPLNEQQLDQLHIQRIDQIKKAALKVFAHRGIIGTKMSMIAAEAGISQGLSYRYFKSKEELFITLIQDALEEAKASMEQVNHLPGTPLEKMRRLTKSMLDGSNKYFFMLIQQAAGSDEVPEKAKQLLEQFSKENPIQLLIPLFIDGQEMGQFCEGDPYKLLFCYFSIITGLMLQEVQADDNYWIHEVDLLMKVIMK